MSHPKRGMKDFLTPPLLVMNNMISPNPTDDLTAPISKQLESLTTTIFQSLFPPISPQHTSLPSIRRVLILDRQLPGSPNLGPASESASYRINLRHYAIMTQKTGPSRRIRRLDATKKLMRDRANRECPLNLGKLNDVAEYLLDPNAVGVGYAPGNESEIEIDEEVEVLENETRTVINHVQFEPSANGADKEFKRGTPNVERRAIRLVELGPRLRLRMIKMEDGVCAGSVMWHEYVSKSKEEVDEMEDIWEGRRLDKEKRKKAQRANVERKNSLGKAISNEFVEEPGMDDDEEWDDDGLEVRSRT